MSNASKQAVSATRSMGTILGIGAVLVILGTLFPAVLQGLLILFAGILLAVFLYHLSNLVARMLNVRYGAAFAIVVILLVLVAVGLTAFMGARIASQISAFTEQFQQAIGQFQTRLEQHPWLRNLPAIPDEGQQPKWSGRLISTAGTAAATLFSSIASFILILFLGFYLALQWSAYRSGILSLVPQARRQRADDVLNKVSKTLWWWCLGRLIGMLIIGAGAALGLWLLGIPLPVTLGVIAGLLNFIPNLGPLIASVPPVLFGLQHGTEVALYVAAFYLILQFVESYLITPLIDQQQVSLPPGLILSSQLLFGILAGFLGLILATPLTAVAYVLVRELYVKDVIGESA